MNFTQTILDFKRIAIQDVINNETNSIENKKVQRQTAN